MHVEFITSTMIGTMNERLVYDFYNECTFSETLSSEGTLRPERATRSYGLIQTFNRTGSLIQTLIPWRRPWPGPRLSLLFRPRNSVSPGRVACFFFAVTSLRPLIEVPIQPLTLIARISPPWRGAYVPTGQRLRRASGEPLLARLQGSGPDMRLFRVSRVPRCVPPAPAVISAVGAVPPLASRIPRFFARPSESLRVRALPRPGLPGSGTSQRYIPGRTHTAWATS